MSTCTGRINATGGNIGRDKIIISFIACYNTKADGSSETRAYESSLVDVYYRSSQGDIMFNLSEEYVAAHGPEVLIHGTVHFINP